jgi:hypothetical protein
MILNLRKKLQIKKQIYKKKQFLTVMIMKIRNLKFQTLKNKKALIVMIVKLI